MQTLPPKAKESINLTSSREFKQLSNLLEQIKKKKKLTTAQIINSVEKKKIIPLNIFCKELSPLETVVKYLKQNQNLTINQISDLLNRSKKTIWQAYKSSYKKYPFPIKTSFSKYHIDASSFKDRKYTVFEIIIKHLKSFLNYHDIAILLKRDDRTIWTVYNRALKK